MAVRTSSLSGWTTPRVGRLRAAAALLQSLRGLTVLGATEGSGGYTHGRPCQTRTSATKPGLARALGLWWLILYGIIVIQPTAPMSPFGVVSVKAQGHVVTTILIAMVAMLFTAISYGRMARVYPSAGSAYTYVGREHPPRAGLRHGLEHGDRLRDEPDHLRDLVQQGGRRLRSRRAVRCWAVFFAALFTGLNLLGIKTSAKINAALRSAWRRGDRHVPRSRRCATVRRPARRAASSPGRSTIPRPSPAARSRPAPPSPSHLHRLRRHLDAVRGGREPAPQHPARHRAHLPDHRRAGRAPGLRGAAGVAGLVELPGHRHRLRARGRQGRRALPCSRS